MSATEEFQQRVARIEGLVHQLDGTADPASRSNAKELIECLMELHAAGIERMLEIVVDSGASGVIDSLAGDELVSSLLVLYGLHPDDFQTRVERALEKARPALRERGAGLEVVTLTEASVHMKITGAGSKELESVVRQALSAGAPDALEVVIEVGKGRAAGSNFVPLGSLQATPRVLTSS
jgi:hypothetical protein